MFAHYDFIDSLAQDLEKTFGLHGHLTVLLNHALSTSDDWTAVILRWEIHSSR